MVLPMHASRRTIVLTLLGPLLGGCAAFRATQNEPLDPAAIRQLEPGRTTAREAVELLGGPTQVVQIGERSAYRYDFTVTKGAGLFLLVFILGHADTRNDRLWLFFDETDLLTHVGSTLESHRAQYAMPWEDIHEDADDRAADAEREGLVPAGDPSK